MEAHRSALMGLADWMPYLATKALGYGWSVLVAAAPANGIAPVERIDRMDDADVQWIVRENRKKSRLKRVLDHVE